MHIMKKTILLTIIGLILVVAVLGGVKGLQIKQMIAQGQVTGRGVLPPERAFPTEPFFAELVRRGIVVEEEIVEEGTLA